MARVYFAVVIYGLVGLLLLAMAAARDQAVIDHYQSRPYPAKERGVP